MHLEIVLNTVYIISVHSKNWKSVMIVLDQCKHSKSMDWIDWKRSKSETIHLLRKRIVMEMINRNHSTYWIVNHWNPFKSVNIVSVILQETLNWRIVHNYDPYKLEQSEVIQTISIILRLWFKVLIWYWIFEWLDLPNLQYVTLGDYVFNKSSSTVIESIEWIRVKWYE